MGTLFDLSEVDGEFAALGAAPSVRRAWFLRVLDSARTVTLLGEYVPFRELARAAVRTTLAQEGIDPEAGERIVERLAMLDPYDDAEAALGRLADAAIASVILTNGSRANTENLLNR